MKTFFLDLTLITYFISFIGFLFYFKTLEKKALRASQLVLGIGALFHLSYLICYALNFLKNPTYNFADTLYLFSFLLVLVYFYFSLSKEKAYTLGTFFVPLPILFLLLGRYFSEKTLLSPFFPFVKSIWFPIHVISSLLSHAFLLSGFVLSLMYLLEEREIKKKRFGKIFKKLPPLHSLERLAEKSLYHGFFFLSFGMITGALWSELAFGDYWRWSAKEVVTLSLWLVYAGMIHQRVLIGWRGKRLAYMFIIGCGLWIFTFFVVNFYFKGFHTYG